MPDFISMQNKQAAKPSVDQMLAEIKSAELKRINQKIQSGKQFSED